MVTSPYECKKIEWDENRQTNKHSGYYLVLSDELFHLVALRQQKGKAKTHDDDDDDDDDLFTGKPTAAICHGAWMFCSTKILKGKKLTCFVAIKDDVENAGYL